MTNKSPMKLTAPAPSVPGCAADRKAAAATAAAGISFTRPRPLSTTGRNPASADLRKIPPQALPGWKRHCLFSGCTLRCIFCQNHTISHENFGQAISARQLSRIFLHLQEQGAYNINLVTPTQYLPHIIEALDLARPSLTIPVVYNCGGYERVETVRALADLVDIWLPDFKYYDSDLARRCCGAPDYFPAASAAIAQMIRQTGSLVWEDVPGLSSPLLKKGSSSATWFSPLTGRILSVFFSGSVTTCPRTVF